MLLAAIEDDLRVEMVNRRMCDSAVGILYRLMTLYAPGGESEKSLTLKKLQTPTRCTDPQLAADELRAWERWKKRAETLGLLTPDPTILVKGLASVTSGVLEKAVNREIAFRTSLVRSVLIAQTAKEITPRVREMAKARIIPQIQTRKEVIP